MLPAFPLNPPPPYLSDADVRNLPAPPPPFSSGSSRQHAGLSSIPPHLLLNIIHHTFPQLPGIDEGRLERQRRTLYWLGVQLRLVNRAFYIACMHVLRSTYLPAYSSFLRRPYSSDPFPLAAPSPTTPDTPRIPSLHRETRVLDLFIALKVREDVWADASDLHLGSEESFRDLFELMQPRARCEDLVCEMGVRAGVVVLGRARGRQVCFEDVSVKLSPRKVGLVLAGPGGARRTVAEVERRRDERLEVAAKALVGELKRWLQGGR
ncbi:hypothetical protein DENSPDRAFT_856423 [Dentipellis sp. KUC8613]|nr:hypothetical protein DENSPDRAFT_856423 [Dentipellis sp. KUC8613]